MGGRFPARGAVLAIAVALLVQVLTAAQPRPGVSLTPNSSSYEVGANYHATTPDFLNTGFIKNYHDPSVRAVVLAQLQTMADTGASLVKTTLWQVGQSTESWRLSFPLAPQQLSNIESYVRDVGLTRRADGGYLDLQMTMAWLGCADYTVGTPATTIGQCGYSWSDFTTRARQSITDLVQRIAAVTRVDGRPPVSKLYLEMEVMIGAKANQDQFLIDLYPFFLNQTALAGLDGSVYFFVPSSEADILDNGYVDEQYAVLDGHRSLYWVYRSVRFLLTNGMPLPGRLDFSFYPDSQTVPYATLVNRVFDDMQAVFPGYQAAVAETYYLADPTKRAELGQAFAWAYLTHGMPEQVVFWSTPYGGATADAGPPFDFAAFLPTSAPPPTPTPTPPPTALFVTVSPSSVEAGGIAQAVARDQAGQAVAGVTWSVEHADLATITPQGWITGKLTGAWANRPQGATGVTATMGSVSGTAFLVVTAPTPTPTPTSLDFNGDGKSDVIWRHNTRGEVWLWPMDGPVHTAETFIRQLPDTNWEIRGLGDQNGDGQRDILWRNSLTGGLVFWPMTGSTPQAEIFITTVDPAHDIVGTSDYNGDGKSDILWRHAGNGQVWIWLMNGAATLSVVHVDTVDPIYTIVGSGDLNADGKADIVWRHTTAGDVWVWLMNGTTRTSQTLVGSVPDLGYQVVGVADHTGDGKADILWRHTTQGHVWVWPMNGTTLVSQSFIGAVDPIYVIVGTGDYNGDGKADILWHRTDTGDVWVWLMNGAVRLSETYVGTVPDLGYQIVNVK